MNGRTPKPADSTSRHGRLLPLVAVVIWALVALGCAHAPQPLEAELVLTAEEDVEGNRFRPTQVVVLNGLEVIVNWGGSSLRYRPLGSSGEWLRSDHQLMRPHAIARGSDGSYYVADTGNHRVVRFADISGGEATAVEAIAGIRMHKPHDIVLEPDSGYLYLIDGNRRLFRFRSFGEDESVWEFSHDEVGYARSLSVVDGLLYVIASTKGRVLRVDDFDRRRFASFQSPGKKSESATGDWRSTGLILNDVDYHHGWWYGSNFFPHRFGRAQPSSNPYCLMRWRNWRDFSAGRWEDLSALIDHRMIPYYLFSHQDSLYLACLGGKVYVLSQNPGRKSFTAANRE